MKAALFALLAILPLSPPLARGHAENCPREFFFLRDRNAGAPTKESRTHHIEYQSKALGRRARVNITLPPGFGGDGRQVPVVFFLHGRGAQSDPQGYFATAGGDDVLNRLHGSRKCGNLFAVVSPMDDLQSYWRQGPKSGKRLGTESFIAEELYAILRACGEKTLDLWTKPAIGGISAGGNGALYYGEKYSHLFGQVYAISPVFRGDSDRELEPEDRAAFGRGREFCEQDIVCRYERLPKKGSCRYPVPRFQVEIAKDDPFYRGSDGVAPEVGASTRRFLSRLQDECPVNAPPFTKSGGHSLPYFRGGVERMLTYFCRGFYSHTGSAHTADPAPH